MIVGILKHGQGDLHFRPLGVISIFLDHRLWNDWPPAYHFTNLVLHSFAVLGVFALTRTLGMSTEGAAGSALIFSILPINTEAVAWIAARFDLLATSLTVWAMVLYAEFRKTGHLRFYASALLMFLAAIFSKESAYVLPLFLFCFELIVSKEQRLKAPAGFLLLGIVAFAYRWAALGGIGGYVSANGDPSVLQFGWKSFEGILLRGPAEMLLGVNWLQPSGGATVATVIILSAISLALAAGFHSNLRRKQLIWLGLLWLIIAELPAHALLLIGPGLTNSRVLYLGSVGLAVVFGTLVDSIEGARLRLIGTSLVVLVFGMLLQHNLRAWQWTSDFSRNSLAELRRLQPSPPANAEFVLSGKPDTIRGVFFFHVGLAEAVKFIYNRTDLRARLENEPNPDQTQAAEVIAIRWNNDRNRPILLNLPYASDWGARIGRSRRDLRRSRLLGSAARPREK